jgi:hypothetical protein
MTDRKARMRRTQLLIGARDGKISGYALYTKKHD